MRKVTVARTGKNGGAPISHDMAVSTMAMILSDEIHQLTGGSGVAGHRGMIEDLGDLADAVSLEAIRGCNEQENFRKPLELSNMWVRIAQLEAGLVMAGHAGCITRARMRPLLSMLGAVKQHCFAPGSDQQVWVRCLPS